MKNIISKLGKIALVLLFQLVLALPLLAQDKVENNNGQNQQLTEEAIINLFKNQFNTGNNNISTNSFSDIFQIAKSGGITKVDTGIIKGIVLNDTTIHYAGDNYDYTVTHWVEYILNGEIVEEWSELVDSAKVSYSLKGKFDYIDFSETREQSAEEFILGGLKPTSEYATCTKISPMLVLGWKLKWWLFQDLFIEEELEFVDLIIDKQTGLIMEGDGKISLSARIGERSFSTINAVASIRTGIITIIFNSNIDFPNPPLYIWALLP